MAAGAPEQLWGAEAAREYGEGKPGKLPLVAPAMPPASSQIAHSQQVGKHLQPPASRAHLRMVFAGLLTTT